MKPILKYITYTFFKSGMIFFIANGDSVCVGGLFSSLVYPTRPTQCQNLIFKINEPKG